MNTRPDSRPGAPPGPPTPDARTRQALKLWVRLSRAHAAVLARAEADVARSGLTIAEFGVLEFLYHQGPALLGEIQRKILVSSGGITFLVDRLTKKGLVERRTSDEDRRARYAALTPAGETLIAAIFPAHAGKIVEAMAGLTGSQQKEASRLLKTLILHARDVAGP